jgi:phosphate transport system protein
MPKHFHRAIDDLMKTLVALSARVEDQVQLALDALHERNTDACDRVIVGDVDVDSEEVHIEEECLKILALHQPVARDLRVVIAVLKINNDLERIGDLAVDIAEHAQRIIANPTIIAKFDFHDMYDRVKSMLHASLDALVGLDTGLARQVILADDEVDDINRRICDDVLSEMKTHGAQAHLLIQYLYISRRLERMADQVTNIAEDIIYMMTGDIVRHGKKLGKYQL